MYAYGASLGGVMLMNYLIESLDSPLKAAILLSVPM